MTNLSFEFFYESFTKDASLLISWCKKVKNVKMTKNSNQGCPACRLACSKTKEKEIQSVLKKYDVSTVRKFVTLQYCDHRNFRMRKISYTSIRELCPLKSFVLRGRCRIHWYTWMASGCYQFSYFQLKVQIIIPKNIGNRKRDCA